MTFPGSSIAVSLISSAVLLSGCAYTGQPVMAPASNPVHSYPSGTYQQSFYGVIDSIQRTDTGNAAQGIGVGTVVGGVVGGLLGNRIGGGNGKKIAIATGAVGGAIIGNQIEQRNTTQLPMYQIGVRLENGSYQTLNQDTIAGLTIGTQVRVENGRVYRY
ncbi:glycine zipper 2TM domain-containing protein [Oxalobacteraceae bacterium R-40]|uniref:Glycine zipper 2TM domain-containing protein n=1 Tax=Keguizhuia sedimenti TaxID=3064264 RepID=A0ABU1BLB3_9BURK|nr:glycine zipper 2TM domain-containing protein [Oxalobacteraceae bacterium R-40]